MSGAANPTDREAAALVRQYTERTPTGGVVFNTGALAMAIGEALAARDERLRAVEAEAAGMREALTLWVTLYRNGYTQKACDAIGLGMEHVRGGAPGVQRAVLAKVDAALSGTAGRALAEEVEKLRKTLTGLLGAIRPHANGTCPGIAPEDCLEAIYGAARMAEELAATSGAADRTLLDGVRAIIGGVLQAQAVSYDQDARDAILGAAEAVDRQLCALATALTPAPHGPTTVPDER